MTANVSYKIYALREPITKEIRYIGITKRSLKLRLYEHICYAKRNDIRDGRTYKANWIKSLLKENLTPEIKLLSTTTEELADQSEIAFIAHYKQFCKLTNNTIGGKTVKGRIITDDIRKRMSEASTRKGIPNSSRWKKVEVLNLITNEKHQFINYQEAADFIGASKFSVKSVVEGKRNSVFNHKVYKV